MQPVEDRRKALSDDRAYQFERRCEFTTFGCERCIGYGELLDLVGAGQRAVCPIDSELQFGAQSRMLRQGWPGFGHPVRSRPRGHDPLTQ